MDSYTPKTRSRRTTLYLIAAALLLLAGSFITNYIANHGETLNSARKSIEARIQAQEIDFNEVLKNGLLLKKLADQTYNQDELDELVSKEYGLFVYSIDDFGLIKLKFWNTPNTLPEDTAIRSALSDGLVTLSNGKFEFIRREASIGGKQKVLVIAYIPVYNQYYVENSHLPDGFAGMGGRDLPVEITSDTTAQPVKSSYGKTLFHLTRKKTDPEAPVLSTILLVLSIVCVLALVHRTALFISRKWGPWKGVVFLISMMVLLRGLSYFLHNPLNTHYALFDPIVYASGYILPSLGDLLINTVFSCWAIIFIKQQTGPLSYAYKGGQWGRWALIVLLSFALVAITFGAADIIKSIINDGRIPFSVTNFFSLNIFSLLSFGILGGICFTYFFVAELLLKALLTLLGGQRIYLYLFAALAGLVILTFLQGYEPFVMSSFALVWLLVYIWLIQQKVFTSIFTRLNVSAILFWIFVYALSISMIVFSENRKIEIGQLGRTASKLTTRTSSTQERIVSLIFSNFDTDLFVTDFYRFKDPDSNRELKDSLTSRYFDIYSNWFVTSIYTFDEKERPLYNDPAKSYDTLNSIFEIEGNATSVPDLRYFEKGFDQYAYICKKTVLDLVGHPAGAIFLLWYPTKQSPKGDLVPELFREDKSHLPDFSLEYSFALYDSLELKSHFNNYEFPSYLTPQEFPQSYKVQRKNGYDLIWFPGESNQTVVFAKKGNGLLEFVTLFAYLVSTFIIIASLYRVILLIIHSKLRWNNLKQYWQFNIRSQIYITIIFISLFSFLVIGLATVVFFYDRYDRNNYESLSSAIQIMANDIQKKIGGQSELNEMVKAYRSGNDNQLQGLLHDIAEIHGADFNLYDTEGNLIVPSNPLIYSRGILSKKMNPVAYYHINKEHLIQYLNQERVGDVAYKSVYTPVKDSQGNTFAYLNIPSFVSQSELKKEISNFLVTIINLNAFIFLIAGVIALFITHRLTSSFLLIGHKMRDINLGKLNEEIVWHREDEIGGLVKEYNKMVVKLEESARALAKSEREGAWREMARQVAHEIKNPLTPMKLSIQYLQKAINNNSDNLKVLSANVAQTLVEQIDHLSKIAADFSQFANIGNKTTEVFDLHDILHSLGSLYEATDNMHFTWLPAHHQVFVEADKTQLNRLFTNLFQNAIEACHSKDYCQLSVTEEVSEGSVVVKVSDNGDGIPESMRKKIFTPNFTTKSSGTGLGLAMSRTIVEQAHGKIWFETEEGQGTTFLVELPVVHPSV